VYEDYPGENHAAHLEALRDALGDQLVAGEREPPVAVTERSAA
jgi:hypothetical protein